MKTMYLQKLRDVIRVRHLALSTERSYVGWVSRFWDFAATLPKAMSREAKMEAFLTEEARRGCAAATQNQAFNAIRFFLVDVMKHELGDVRALRAKRPATLRVAPSAADTVALLEHVRDVGGYPTRLIAQMLYGCGLRVNEPLSLRLKDVDLRARQLRIWGAKGGAARVVALPACLLGPIESQARLAAAMWERDAAAGIPVPLPDLLGKKKPVAAFARGWYWLFPARTTCRHPRTGDVVRWRCHEANVQRAVAEAAAAVGLRGMVSPHSLRHAYATHAIDSGARVTDLQAALGHKSLETTQGYVHSDGLRVRSPLEAPTCR